VLVPFAQDFGGRRARGLDQDVSLDSLEPTSRRLQVATEQELGATLESRPFLRSLTPPTGSPTVRFSVAFGDGQPDTVRQTARDLVKDLRSTAGLRTLHGAGLRAGATGTASTAGTPMPDPPADVVAGLLNTWRLVSVPSSILAVVDVSGSMDFAAGTSTRMGVLARSASVGIGMLPRDARVGLWVFSVNRGSAGQDWLALEPTRRLDKLDHGRTQRYALQERIAQLPGLTDGGTGLYDTALAAYKQALSDYRPGFANSVVLLTDGANDDPGSITLQQLTHQLQKLRDPSRPTRIVTVGISQDADMPALRAIAAASGGEAFQAVDPADIAGVFARALLARES
jgi:Mg-chelatase subunit ChlD